MSSSTPSGDLFQLVSTAQQRLDQGFAQLPSNPAVALGDEAASILGQVALRLQDNYPYGHPLYAGQMLKPPHPIARAAYTLAMSVNPNNHALDGGRASSALEIEAVAELARMVGWTPENGGYLGHLTSGGTFANLEALWAAGRLERTTEDKPKYIVASDQAHYTHSRISEVLGLPFASIATGDDGRMDLAALRAACQTRNVGTVVATLGTTAIGAVDPLDGILKLQQEFGFRIHVDAAYGGYFTLASNLSAASRAAFDAIQHVDSLVIDPHKHGLQPYGCGAILFRDLSVGRLYKHDSPYTYFSSKELHLGEISLECSRAGASAVALWATQQLLPYVAGGKFAEGLDAGRSAALELYRRIGTDERFIVPTTEPALDILFWAVKAKTLQESSEWAQRIFEEAAKNDLHLALARLPVRYFSHGSWASGAGKSSDDNVICLRSVLMKPDHLVWLDTIWERLLAATSKA